MVIEYYCTVHCFDTLQHLHVWYNMKRSVLSVHVLQPHFIRQIQKAEEQ